MPSNRLFFIAHAETAATRRAAFPLGREPLLEAGLAAARARRAGIAPVGIVLASPALASRQTAEALDLVAEAEPALRDLDVGCWAGKEIADVPLEDLADWSSDIHFARHGGESLAALVDRLQAFVATRHGRGSTLAVTHPAIVRAALVAALDAPIQAFWRIDVPPLQALALGSDGRRWALRGFSPWGAQTAANDG